MMDLKNKLNDTGPDDNTNLVSTTSSLSRNALQFKTLSLKEERISKCDQKSWIAASFDYQQQLREQCEFNEEAIQEMAENLIQLLTSANKIERIATKLPKCTAVKVIAALEKLESERPTVNKKISKDYYQLKDNYLMTSLNNLQESTFKNEVDNSYCNLLVVVCEGQGNNCFICADKDDDYYESKIANKRMIIINHCEETGVFDDLKFSDLGEQFKKILLSKTILFQGTFQTVESLIQTECNPDDVIDLDSMEELIQQEWVEIPSFTSSRFEKSFYIPRRLTPTFPLDDRFWSEVTNELGNSSIEQLQTKCKVNSKGEIQWNVAHDKKSQIWDEMNHILEKRNSPSSCSLSCRSISENDLLVDCDQQNKLLSGVVIISGVAGAGKSSILSHYYEEMKEKNPRYWVIVINLRDHSKSFSKLDYRSIDKQTAINSLINLSLVVGKSRFARSLLKHRLETGDGIVIMLDGFDESQYKENVLLLIKELKQMKFVGLYVTTRSHMAHYLQLQLSQLAYNLDNFSKQDQINYLTLLWKRDLQENNRPITYLEEFTKRLVELMSKTLGNEERANLGIPMQCRILAECIESQVKKASNQQEFHSLLVEINGLNFNLANLYRLKMKTKYQINVEAQIRNNSVGSQQQFLIDLAIRTIVSRQDYVNLLLENPPKCLPESETGSIVVGLLDLNAEGEMQFLHQTYAEYFMADYLYTSFPLDDYKEGNLLHAEKNTREFIKLNIILTKNHHYAGVLVFYDSMLKEIVNENKNWQEIINKKRELPYRLQLFTQLWKTTKNVHEILLSAIKNRNANIFKFLFDCFDVMLDATEIRKIMRSAIHSSYFQIFQIFSGKNSSETFQRFIKHYHIAADKSEVNRIFITIQQELSRNQIHFCDWNNKERRQIVDLVLDFLLNYKATLKQIETERGPENLLLRTGTFHFFMCNNYYTNQLRKWIEISSHLYDDNSFAKLFLGTERLNRLNCRNSRMNIKQTLTILRNIGRNKLLDRLTRLVLLWDSQTFESFYLDPTSQSQPLLSLTRLQQAAFYGATPKVKAIIDEEPETSKNELLGKYDASGEKEDGKSAEEFMDDDMVRSDQSITPLYLAAARGHEEVCRVLIVFFKNDLFQGTTGALRDAIYVRKIEMFELILKIVKEDMGQDYLLRLLQSKYPGDDQDLYWAATSLDRGDYDKKLWYRKVADLIVCKNEQYWNDLNDFVLRDRHSIKSLEYIDHETAKKMMAAKGFKNWIQRLLDTDIREGFLFLFQAANCDAKTKDKLTCRMSVFNGMQLSDFLVIFTSSTDERGRSRISHWVRILQMEFSPETFKIMHYPSKDLFKSFLNYLELIVNQLSQSEINERLFDDEGIEAITRSLLKHGRESLVNVMLDFILGGDKRDIKRHMVEKLIKEIANIIGPVTEEEKNQRVLYGHVNIMWTRVKILVFIMDNANCSKKLTALVDAILAEYPSEISERKRSIWNCYFEKIDGRSEEMMLEKLDNFLKFVLDTSGESDVRKLVDGNITNALTHWNDSRLNVLLRHLLSNEMQIQEIGRNVVKDAIEIMNHKGFYGSVYYWKNIQQFVIDYADHVELTKLIQIITQKHQINYDEKERSVWSSYLRDEYFYRMESVSYMSEVLPKNVEKFLKCISEKLGRNKVKELVFHEYTDLYGNRNTVIQFAKLERKYKLVRVLITQLNKEDGLLSSTTEM